MHIWTSPKVTTIGTWVFQGHPDYDVPSDGDNITRGLAFAAKGCYKSFGADGRPCVENQKALLEHGHGSVLEHAAVSFYIEGISRALTLEMNRHRHLSISQESTRYVDESNSGIVLEPYIATLYERLGKGWADAGEKALVDSHIEASVDAINFYTDQVELLEHLNPLRLKGFDLRKWARGKARNVLPHNLESKVTYTANLRAWRHFIELRSERHAEPEIRRLCSYIYDELMKVAPLYFGPEQYDINMFPTTDIKWYPIYPEYKPKHRKV